MANLKLVADAMFYKRSEWSNISDEEKELCFFIFNRYFSKSYHDKSYLLNLKSMDKVSAMNIWFEFMKNKQYPKWFWSKSELNKEKSKYTDKDILLLRTKLNLKESDIKYLISKHEELMKEELLYLKKIEKENNNN